jgi:mono/diheme cytochrome c family protein
MRHLSRTIGVAALAALLVFACFLLWAHRPPIGPIAPLPRRIFRPELVKQGERLVSLGDCRSCHSITRMADFAGGPAIRTPLGQLYGPNITPDRTTGIGTWSFEAFDRAMRDGVGRDGRHLYPAMPYDHFAALTRDDVAALYAYLMTRQPIHAIAPAHRLVFPLQFRPLLAAWRLFFIRKRQAPDGPGLDPAWRRGAYLSEGLAHCGACHTPRNWLQGERYGHPLAGGWADGWTTPALDGTGKHWTAAQLETYLSTGRGPDGTQARGPMAKVVTNLAAAPRGDVHAIAIYIASRMAGARPHPR